MYINDGLEETKPPDQQNENPDQAVGQEGREPASFNQFLKNRMDKLQTLKESNEKQMNELQAQLELKKQMTREELHQQGGGGYLSLGQQYNLNKYQLELGQPQRGQSTTNLNP